MKKLNRCIDCNQETKPSNKMVSILGVRFDRDARITYQLIRCGCEKKSHCGAVHYKGKAFYFCHMKRVESMCKHPQLRNDLFLEVYNEQFKK